MTNRSENFSAMHLSGGLKRSPDNVRQNGTKPPLEQFNTKARVREKQRELHKNVEAVEHQQADKELTEQLNPIISIDNLDSFLQENFLGDQKAKVLAKEFLNIQNSFGALVREDMLITYLQNNLMEAEDLSTAEQVKNFKEKLSAQGQSPVEILQLLINQFEHEPAVSTWVENWQNFLRLHQLAGRKSPTEQQAIQTIIGQADFTSETAFSTALNQIADSTAISEQTKVEIAQAFNGATVRSVTGLDRGLKHIKSQKQKLTKAITVKTKQSVLLDLELQRLEAELSTLSQFDPSREQLEAKIKQLHQAMQNNQYEIEQLTDQKPEVVSFELRKGVQAVLHPDGSRSVQIESLDFAIKLPGNRLPFQGTKNLRCINLAFLYPVLQKQGIADFMFTPSLQNGKVPTKAQRDMGHILISGLGFDDRQILSETEISQLHQDLTLLTATEDYTSGLDCLASLGIYDPVLKKLNQEQLKKVLGFIRENRGMKRELVFEALKFHLS